MAVREPACTGTVLGKKLILAFGPKDQSPFAIKPGMIKRYYGLLLEHTVSGQLRESLLLTPYVTPQGHMTMMAKANEAKWKKPRALWMGALVLANQAQYAGGVALRMPVANDTSEWWDSWTQGFRPAKIDADNFAILDPQLPHENSLDNLHRYLGVHYPNWCDDRTELRRSGSGAGSVFLDPDMDTIARFFEEERARYRQPARSPNVMRDIRTPIATVVYSLEVVTSHEADATRKDYAFSEILVYQTVLTQYLNLLQTEFPDDVLLRDARRTLGNISAYAQAAKVRSFVVEELERLLHLKEVLEFIDTEDRSAVQCLDPM